MTLSEIFSSIKFTYTEGSSSFRSNITGQEIPITPSFQEYLRNLQPESIQILKKSSFEELNQSNDELFQIIENIKKSLPSITDKLDIFLKELYSLELRVVLYICQKTKNSQNSELIDKFIDAVTPKLKALNQYYDQKLVQQGGSDMNNHFNLLYKGIKYKGKYKKYLN